MNDQEHAKAIYDARKAFNNAARAARDAGLRVDVTTFAIPILELGYNANRLEVDISRKLSAQ
jgi:hypothetical protein